jgi:hypothetical protein
LPRSTRLTRADIVPPTLLRRIAQFCAADCVEFVGMVVQRKGRQPIGLQHSISVQRFDTRNGHRGVASPNPSNNLVEHLINRKIGRVENMHTPSRVTELPIGPTLPTRRIEFAAAYHILPPLGIDDVHARPRRPGQHILCHSICSTPSEGGPNALHRGNRGERHEFRQCGALTGKPVFRL